MESAKIKRLIESSGHQVAGARLVVGSDAIIQQMGCEMKKDTLGRDEYDELARQIYNNDPRAVSEFHERLSRDTEHGALGALVAEPRHVLALAWNMLGYSASVQDIRKLNPCFRLASDEEWLAVHQIASSVESEDEKVGNYQSIKGMKVCAAFLNGHGLDVLLVFNGMDPGWAAVAVLPYEPLRRAINLLGRLPGVEGLAVSDVNWPT